MGQLDQNHARASLCTCNMSCDRGTQIGRRSDALVEDFARDNVIKIEQSEKRGAMENRRRASVVGAIESRNAH